MDKIKTKVLVIHGTEDEVIDFHHGLQIYELAADKYDPLWVEGAGHNDIEHYPIYTQRLLKLIKDLEEVRRKRENDAQQMLRDVEDTKTKTENVGKKTEKTTENGCSEVSMQPAVLQMVE